VAESTIHSLQCELSHVRMMASARGSAPAALPLPPTHRDSPTQQLPAVPPTLYALEPPLRSASLPPLSTLAPYASQPPPSTSHFQPAPFSRLQLAPEFELFTPQHQPPGLNTPASYPYPQPPHSPMLMTPTVARHEEQGRLALAEARSVREKLSHQVEHMQVGREHPPPLPSPATASMSCDLRVRHTHSRFTLRTDR
jgi:hypothetical protein